MSDNKTRIDRIDKLVGAFIAAHMPGDYAKDGSEKHIVVRDLLVDIRHWCAANGVPFDTENERAEDHFERETQEAAYERKK